MLKIIILAFIISTAIAESKVGYICRAAKRVRGVELLDCQDWFEGNWRDFKAGGYAGLSGSEFFIVILATVKEMEGVEKMKEDLIVKWRIDRIAEKETKKIADTASKEKKRKSLHDTFRMFQRMDNHNLNL